MFPNHKAPKVDPPFCSIPRLRREICSHLLARELVSGCGSSASRVSCGKAQKYLQRPRCVHRCSSPLGFLRKDASGVLARPGRLKKRAITDAPGSSGVEPRKCKGSLRFCNSR